jgi:hypothetical protein
MPISLTTPSFHWTNHSPVPEKSVVKVSETESITAILFQFPLVPAPIVGPKPVACG